MENVALSFVFIKKMWANTFRTDQKATRLLTTITRTPYQRSLAHYLIKAGEKKGGGLSFQREMKQFCLYLLCYLARTAQINYSHLPHSIHYSSCKHISQMKCLWAHLAFLSSCSRRQGGSAFQCAASRVLKKPSAIYGIWYLPPLLPIAASQEALMYEICQCQFPS